MTTRKSTKSTQKVEVSVSTLNVWLLASMGNMLVWNYVLSIVLRHLNIPQDLQTPGDLFSFGVTLAMAVLSVLISISIGIARLRGYSEEVLL